jgi:hypothetical protein
MTVIEEFPQRLEAMRVSGRGRHVARARPTAPTPSQFLKAFGQRYVFPHRSILLTKPHGGLQLPNRFVPPIVMDAAMARRKLPLYPENDTFGIF